MRYKGGALIQQDWCSYKKMSYWSVPIYRKGQVRTQQEAVCLQATMQKERWIQDPYTFVLYLHPLTASPNLIRLDSLWRGNTVLEAWAYCVLCSTGLRIKAIFLLPPNCLHIFLFGRESQDFGGNNLSRLHCGLGIQQPNNLYKTWLARCWKGNKKSDSLYD